MTIFTSDKMKEINKVLKNMFFGSRTLFYVYNLFIPLVLPILLVIILGPEDFIGLKELMIII